MTMGLLRFLAGNGAICTAMGAEWTLTTAGREACVIYGEWGGYGYVIPS